MNDKPPAEDRDPDVPTYGDLRRQLAKNGTPWSVDPQISDDEPLPAYPLGALPEDMADDRAVVRVPADANIRALIGEIPPSDPGLQQRWRQVGLRIDRPPKPTRGDRAEAGEEPEPEPRPPAKRPPRRAPPKARRKRS